MAAEPAPAVPPATPAVPPPVAPVLVPLPLLPRPAVAGTRRAA